MTERQNGEEKNGKQTKRAITSGLNASRGSRLRLKYFCKFTVSALGETFRVKIPACVKPPNVIANFMHDTLNNFKVTDRQSFIKFLDLLHKGFLENPESWENKTLPDFLEALSAYTEDIQGYYDNMKLNVNADKPDWSIFADIFKGATIYE